MKKLYTLLFAFLALFSFMGISGCNQKEADTTGPVISVSGVPESGYLGREVILPAATATDDVDGDVTSSVQVTATGFVNGESKEQPLYQKPASKETKFTPKNAPDWEIVYSVRDAAGNRTEKKFTFKALADTIAPVIEITEEDFDISTGLTGSALTGFTLPKTKGIDQPGDFDLTSSILVTIKAENETNNANSVVFQYDEEVHYLCAGNYIVTYTLQDGGKLEAEPVTFPLTIEKDDLYGKNLLSENAMVIGHDARFNEFGELEIGKTSDGVSDDNLSTASLRYAKFGSEYVAVSVNIDPAPSAGGDTLYDIGYVASKRNDKYEADGSEGSWIPNMVLRIRENDIIFLHSIVGDGYQSGGSGPNIRDGKDHTIYMKMEREGTKGQDDAKFIFNVWVDVIPQGNEPTMSCVTTCGAENATGVMNENDFNTIWDSMDGWLAFGGWSWHKDSLTDSYADDVMRVKNIAVFAEDESEFALDMIAPVLTVSGSVSARYHIGETITFPQVTVTDNKDVDIEDNLKVYVTDGEIKEDITQTLQFTPDSPKTYTLIYEVTDASGNTQYVKFVFDAIVADETAPVIEVDTEELNVEIGEVFELPVASATDNIDGDLTSLLAVTVKGSDANPNLFGAGVVQTHVIMAAGEHCLVYWVEDRAGNIATAEVVVNVSVPDTLNGNIISTIRGYDQEDEKLIVASGAPATYENQKVYEEKVDMIVNVINNPDMWFINVRGDIGSTLEWPNGMVIRFRGNAGIEVSMQGHDGLIFGSFPDPFGEKYNQKTDVLLSFQTMNIYVKDGQIVESGGEEYIWFRLWFCEEELAATASGKGIAFKDLVTDSADKGGVCIKISDLTGQAAQNINAGYLHMVGYGGYNVEIKQIRLDGSKMPDGSWAKPLPGAEPTELPEISTAPTEFFASQESPVTTLPGDFNLHQTGQITTGLNRNESASDETKVVLESISFSMRRQLRDDAESEEFNTGWAEAMLLGPEFETMWTTGIMLRFHIDTPPDNIVLMVGGVIAAKLDFADPDMAAFYAAWNAGETVYINYTVTYWMDDIGATERSLERIGIDFYVGTDKSDGTGIDWKAARFYSSDSELCLIENGGTASERGNTVILKTSKIANATDYAPNGLYIIVLGNTTDGSQTGSYASNFNVITEYVRKETIK